MKKLTYRRLTMLFLLGFISFFAVKADIISPDGTIRVSIGLDKGKPYYQVYKFGDCIIEKSFLGFVLKNNDSFCTNFKMLSAINRKMDEQWAEPWGEESTVRNNFNETTYHLSETTGKQRKLDIIFRVFNDGLGFRYAFPKQENLKDFVIMDEITEFALTGQPQAWSIPSNHTNFFENLYKKAPVMKMDTACTPLTIEMSNGLYLAIHEANLTDYAGLNLCAKSGLNTLKADLTPWSTGEKVFAQAPFQSPWRTIIIAQKPGDLLLSRMMLNLNEPSKFKDTSWIEPGRYIGIWWGMHLTKYTWEQGPKHGATTENTKRYIDFAAKHGFSGVLVEGWNEGWNGDWTKNGNLFNFSKPYPDFDIQKIADYAAQKHVRIIGHHETGGAAKNYETQLDDAYKFCNKYGITIVKTGYVNPLLDNKELHSCQYSVRHYRKVIETAALYHISIDNHEPMTPTGLQRTFPNLLSQEGVRGQEYDAWSDDGGNPPEHTTIIPFTRGLAGPMDFTPGTFNFSNPAKPGTHVQTTLAKQLALAVILYSPVQMASDMIENYENNPAFEFITSCPTNWAKTLVPEAKIGDYTIIARKDRKSDNWFVGAITDENERELYLSCSFLDKGANYKAKIFKDGKGADYKTNPYPVDIESINVTSLTSLKLKLAAGGGAAIIISKQ